MQSPRDKKARCLRRQQATRVNGGVASLTDLTRPPASFMVATTVSQNMPLTDRGVTVEAPAVCNWAVSLCKRVGDPNYFGIKVGPNPYEVLKAVDDKFGKQLTANGIIYTLHHHGILPPEWGYMTPGGGPDNIQRTAESIVSYRKSVPRLTKMIDAVRSRELLEDRNWRFGGARTPRSFYNEFERSLSKVGKYVDVSRGMSLPAGLTTTERDGSDNVLELLSTIEKLLTADVAEFSPPLFGVSAHDFNAFAGRLEAFLDGLSTVMSAAPFSTTYDGLKSEIDVDALSNAWDAVFPRLPRTTKDITVSSLPTESVVDGVHMLAVEHNAAVDATGNVLFANVYASIAERYPDRVREFVASAAGIDIDDLGTKPLRFAVPSDRLATSFSRDGVKPISFSNTLFQGLHDDLRGGRVDAEFKLFCYFSTKRPDGKHHLSTSAFYSHAHAPTPTPEAMVEQDIRDASENALFQNDALGELGEAGKKANRFASAISSQLHRPQFPLAHAVHSKPFVVFAVADPTLTSHGAPLPSDGADYFERVMARARNVMFD